jgi:hypothetical protein
MSQNVIFLIQAWNHLWVQAIVPQHTLEEGPEVAGELADAHKESHLWHQNNFEMAEQRRHVALADIYHYGLSFIYH